MTDDTTFRSFGLTDFLSTIHQGQVAIWSWDPVSETAYLDELAMTFWGADQDAMAMDTLWQRIHPDDRERARAEWRASASSDDPYVFSFRIALPDTPLRWIEARGAGHASDRPDEVKAIFLDVTELQRQRALQDQLVREMNHRIGNLFAVAGGLVSMARQGADDADQLARDLRGRFSEMASAYRAISQSDAGFDGVASLGAVMTSLLSPYKNMRANMVITVPDDLIMSSEKVPNLAMILHELATNAVKYGALDDAKGALDVTVTDAPDVITLTWSETAAHLTPDSARAEGFGTRMIDQITQLGFGGEVTREFADQTLRVTCTLNKQMLENVG